MSATALDALRDRLNRGIRPEEPTAADDIRRHELAAPLRRLWHPEGPVPDRSRRSVEAGIEELRAALTPQESASPVQWESAAHLLRQLVARPERLLEEAHAALSESRDPRITWAWACWAVEAAWRCVHQAPEREAGVRDLLPWAARARFLLLCEPFRYADTADDPWRPDEGDADYGRDEGPAGWCFGEGSAALLRSRALAARREWLACLDAYQSHPVLAQAPPRHLEEELRAVASARGYRTGPSAVSGHMAEARGGPDVADRAAAAHLVERHLLPRFQLGEVAVLAWAARPGRVWAARAAGWLAWFPAVLFLAAVAMAVCGLFTAAAAAATAAYAGIGVGALVFGGLWASLWLLRFPAAAAVGLVPLVAFSGWWLGVDWGAGGVGWASAVLVGASMGYLAVEARNHGLGGWAAMRRAAAVGVFGAAHAFLVSLAGLVLVASAFDAADGAASLAATWSGPAGPAWAVLTLSSAWCLAVGVFSQILWDDRPVTAPLAHLRWEG